MERNENQQINLFQSEQRYHKMIEEVEDYAILMMDNHGNIQNWNRGAEKIKGYTEKEILGKNFSLFYLPHDRESQLPQKLIRQAAATGRAVHEGWRQRKDGTAFWGYVVITALHDENNTVIGFTKVTRDLTERKLAEEQKERDARSIQMQNRQLEEFAYITSHDLQEPIRKIQTFINLIQKDLDNRENLEKYLAKMSTSADRMVVLIKDVLNFSRLSAQHEKFEAVRLSEIISGVLSDFELLIAEKEATINIINELPEVFGIQVQLTQLFSNLISNAIKFNTGKPVITITAAITREITDDLSLATPMHTIKIKDNGIGFDPEYTEQAFQPFKRLTNTYSGTGIGLALCKRIVENHKGTITVTSVPGEGTEFTIKLPYDKPEIQ